MKTNDTKYGRTSIQKLKYIAWQSGHMDRCQYSNSAPFLAGPTPSEAYKDPNREMKLIKKMGEMFQKMTSEILNMNW